MRTLAIMAVAFAALFLTGVSASAQYTGGSWCANYGGGRGGGGTNCGFHSFDQCQAALSGNGGMCSRNQWSSGNRDSRRRQRD